MYAPFRVGILRVGEEVWTTQNAFDSQSVGTDILVRPRANAVRPYGRRERPLCRSANFHQILRALREAPLQIVFTVSYEKNARLFLQKDRALYFDI